MSWTDLINTVGFAVAVPGAIFLLGYWFLKWERRVEQRDYEKNRSKADAR